VGRIEAAEYGETVKRVTMFLKGRSQDLLKTMRDKMDLQAAERRYEEAGRTRDQLFALQSVVERQRISSPQRADAVNCTGLPRGVSGGAAANT